MAPATRVAAGGFVMHEVLAAVQRDVLALLVIAIGYAVTCLVQNYQASRKAEAKALAKSQSLASAPASKASTASQSGAAQQQLAQLKALCAERRVVEAKAVLASMSEQKSYHYNMILEACIGSKDLITAEVLVEQAARAGVADVVTYNTLIKSFLLHGDFKGAHKVCDAMASVGLAPNCVTFNELLDATIKKDVRGAWKIVDRMQELGVKPNHITASILLKIIQPGMHAADIERATSIMESLHDAMDEVLLGSMIEACIRVNRQDLLLRQLQRQRSAKRVQMSSGHTFGSLIRAYGYVHDLDGVWATWQDMHTRRVPLTSVTLGNMVEALVVNGEPDTAYKIISEVRREEQTRAVVNAVTYGSVLKGFSQQRRFECVWKVYQEMVSSGVQLSMVTYNTLVNACCRCQEMDRIPSVLESMQSEGVTPDTITYSSIIKGYCQEGRIEEAFELMDAMSLDKNFQPDEFTYNTLIDGCARQGMYARGQELLDEMVAKGVAPSNFTLSVLVKSASRAKRLGKAFEMCEELSEKYKFELNVHVYNNLIQACVNNGTPQRGLEVLVGMVQKRVAPEIRTYKLLVNSCVRVGDGPGAAGLLRAALGLPGVHPALATCSASALKTSGGSMSELVSVSIDRLAGRSEHHELAMRLMMEVRKAGVKLDAKLSLRLTEQGMNGKER